MSDAESRDAVVRDASAADVTDAGMPDPGWVQKAFKYRLYPTPAQERYLNELVGAARVVHNFLIACDKHRDRYWRTWYVRAPMIHGRKPIKVAADGRPTENSYTSISTLRDYGYAPWLARVPGAILNGMTSGYESGWKNFFDAQKKPGTRKVGRPTFKSRWGKAAFGWQNQSCTVRRVSARYAIVGLPKPDGIDKLEWEKLGRGLIKIRTHRPWRGEQRTVTISRDAGAWYVSVLFRWRPHVDAAGAAIKPRHQRPGTSVGVDMGVVQLFALSDGRTEAGPSLRLEQLDKLVRRRQRALRKRTKGSKNYAKAKASIAKLKARQARLRNDSLNKAAHEIASRYETVCVENLKVANMTASAAGTVEAPGTQVAQKRGLNRKILQNALGAFRLKIKNKVETYGGNFILVPPQYTSQTCSACGVVDAASRRSQREFVCVACGHAENADVNAAKNILSAGLAARAKNSESSSESACGGAIGASRALSRTVSATREAGTGTRKGSGRRRTTPPMDSGPASSNAKAKTSTPRATTKVVAKVPEALELDIASEDGNVHDSKPARRRSARAKKEVLASRPVTVRKRSGAPPKGRKR